MHIDVGPETGFIYLGLVEVMLRTYEFVVDYVHMYRVRSSMVQRDLASDFGPTRGRKLMTVILYCNELIISLGRSLESGSSPV